MTFILLLISLNIGLFYCNSNNPNELYKSKSTDFEEIDCTQENNVSDKNTHTNVTSNQGKSITDKSNDKEVLNTINKSNKKTKLVEKIKPAKKTSNPKKVKDASNRNEVKSKKRAGKKSSKKARSDESDSVSESKSGSSEEPKFQLAEGEMLLDFSALAKLKHLNLSESAQTSSQDKSEKVYVENPLLNWNCTSLSLEEEKNISTGYLDKRISHLITHAESYPEGGTKLLKDMKQYYCYLKHVNRLVIDGVRRGRTLMKQLVEEEPEFTQIGFDTDELAEHFSWIKEETEAFERIMDGMCYQWKCLVARLKHK